jgi:hypothetical protein
LLPKCKIYFFEKHGHNLLLVRFTFTSDKKDRITTFSPPALRQTDLQLMEQAKNEEHLIISIMHISESEDTAHANQTR